MRRYVEGADGGALTANKLSRCSATLVSVLCLRGSLGSKPASFLILAIASFSDEPLTTTKSEVSRLERRMRIVKSFFVVESVVERLLQGSAGLTTAL